MKRVVGLSLLVLFILLVVAGSLFYLQNHYGITRGKAVSAIPAAAAFFIEADVSSGIILQFSKTPYWKELQSKKYFKKINNDLLSFDSLLQSNEALKKLMEKEKLIISAHVTRANEFDLLFLINLPVADQEDFADKMIKKISVSDEEPNTRSYGDVSIKEFALKNGSMFSYAVSKNIFIGSFTAFLVEDAIRQQKVAGRFFNHEKSINEIFTNASTDKSARLFINYKNLPNWLSVFKNVNKSSGFNQLDDFASWTGMNVEFNNNSIELNGNTLSKDSSEFAFHLQAQQPVESEVFKILPKKTAAFLSVSLSDKEIFFSSFQKYLNHSANAPENNLLLNKIKSEYKFSPAEKFYGITGNEFALLITEPATINFDNGSYFILKTNDVSKAKKTLQGLSILVDKKQNETNMQEKYNNFFIGLVRLQGIIPALYGNMFNRVNKMYYTFVGNYIVFANQAVALRAFIDDFTSGSLLLKETAFKSLSVNLSLKTNYLLYSRIPACRYIYKSVLSEYWNKQADSLKNYFDKWQTFSYSITGGNKNLSTACLLQYNAKNVSGGATLLWSAQLDTSVSMKPQVVMDATQNIRYIMVQDDANNLYLLDNSGIILWKKKLTEKIISDIHTIDLYNNNSSEYLFNTVNYLFVIDINGNTVSNFPIRLPAAAANALSVFDFDNSNDYSIYLACNNGMVYGYEGSGKRLAGWNFDYQAGIINQPVQSFNISGRNYLVMSDNNGDVFILDHTGRALINTTSKVVRKPNVDFYSGTDATDQASFVTMDIAGNIVNILMNGEVEINPVDAVSSSENFMVADLNGDDISDYVFTEKDNVSAYTNQMALLFNQSLNGVGADEIQLYNLGNERPSIGITSSGSNKIFLLKNDGSLFKGFPVKGSTSFAIDKLNSDGKFYLVAGSDDGNIYVYSLN